MTLALDLAWSGIDITDSSVKRAGGMEVLRCLDVAAKLHNARLPADYPHSIGCG